MTYRQEHVNELGVVWVVDVCPVDAFSCVLFLFLSKDGFVKEELYLLVGNVDAKLLEAVTVGYVLKSS